MDSRVFLCLGLGYKLQEELANLPPPHSDKRSPTWRNTRLMHDGSTASAAVIVTLLRESSCKQTWLHPYSPLVRERVHALLCGHGGETKNLILH